MMRPELLAGPANGAADISSLQDSNKAMAIASIPTPGAHSELPPPAAVEQQPVRLPQRPPRHRASQRAIIPRATALGALVHAFACIGDLDIAYRLYSLVSAWTLEADMQLNHSAACHECLHAIAGHVDHPRISV